MKRSNKLKILLINKLFHITDLSQKGQKQK